MPDLTFAAFSPGGGELRRHALPLAGPGSSCVLRLRGLAGASAVHLAVFDGRKVRLRLEIPLEDDEPVAVHVELDAAGALHAWTSGPPALTLPPDPSFEPLSPIVPATEGGDLDLAVVVDMTLRTIVHDEKLNRAVSKLVLADPAAWRPHAVKLADLARELAGAHRSLRIAVLAFGDQRPPDAKAADLIPDYVLYPESPDDRTLQASGPEELLDRLLVIPKSSGGDFVDALADALHACTELNWRPGARRILLVSGDSPGHSVLEPMPKGCDASVRQYDLETQALRLHEKKVEVVTVYHDPPRGTGLFEFPHERKLLQQTRAQYLRLASLEELAFEAAGFEAATAAAALLAPRGPIARGAAHGALVEVLPGPGTPNATEVTAQTADV